MVGGMAEGGWETGAVSCAFTGGGPAVCVGDGGEREIPDFDADAGKLHGVSGAFLLPDGQPFSYIVGGSPDGCSGDSR